MAKQRRVSKRPTIDVKRHFLFVTTTSTSDDSKAVAPDDVVRWTSLDSTKTVKVRFRQNRTPLLNGERKFNLSPGGVEDTSIDPNAAPGVYRYRTNGETPSRGSTDDDSDGGGLTEPKIIVAGQKSRAKKKR
jgi:hypothetical protein